MFYWLECMQFDNENGEFKKLDLKGSQSQAFIKQSFLLESALNWFVYSIIITYFAAVFILVFRYQNGIEIIKSIVT